MLGPKAVAQGGCAAARSQEGCWRVENRVSETEAACLGGGLRSEPCVFGDGNSDDSSEAVFFRERSLHKEEADWRHRADMTADLTPAEAPGKKDAGFGPGLEADELGHESFGTVQFVLDFAEAEIWGSRMEIASCGGFGQGVLGKGFGWNLSAFCGVHFEASVIQPSLETTKEGLSRRPPFRR